MTTLPFEPTPTWQRALRGGAIVVSLLLHLGLGAGGNWMANQGDGEEDEEEQWLEMTVVEPPPPPPPPPEPPPEPEPEPEPEKPKPKPPPEPVDIEDTVKEAPPEKAPETRRPVRRVQGLSASSFAQGSGTGVDARAGTTVGTKAGDKTLSIDEAKESVAFAAVTVAPKCRPPKIEITKEINDQLADDDVDGSVRLKFDVGNDGRVKNIKVTRSLHPVADKVCVDGWKAHRCTPGKQGDSAVTVTGMTYGCAIKGLD